MGRGRRIRQHVNPLAAGYLSPRATAVAAACPGPSGRPTGPVEVELGCADGEFSFEWARAEPRTIVVGLDIREAMLVGNRRTAAAQGLANLHFAYVNLGVDLDRCFAPGTVDRFHLLFPDPWFKERHRKRRVVDAAFVHTVERLLRPGGELHVASDVFELTLDALGELELAAPRGWHNLAGGWRFWRGNPFPAASRRERTTLARGQRVWRVRFGWQAVP
jgi:tRNA (guanine-N7-)-methyltransferase